MPKYDRYGNAIPDSEQKYDRYGNPISDDREYDQYGQSLHVAVPRPAQPMPPVGATPSGPPIFLIGVIAAVLLLICGAVGAAFYFLREVDSTPVSLSPQPATVVTAETVIAKTVITNTPTVEGTPIASPTPEPTPTFTEQPTSTSEPLVTVPAVVVPLPKETGGLSSDEAEALRQEVEEAINRHNRLRVEGLLTNDLEKFKQIKAGDELEYQLSNINYYIATNSHWEIELKEMTIDSFIINSPVHVEVALTKLETGLYYPSGSTEPDAVKSYYDDRYNMGYVMEKINGEWYITKITGVKGREY